MCDPVTRARRERRELRELREQPWRPERALDEALTVPIGAEPLAAEAVTVPIGDLTVAMGSATLAADATVRAPSAPDDQPTYALAPPAPEGQPTYALVLRAPEDQSDDQPTYALAPPGPGELLRFGPGVPVPAAAGLGPIAAIWRGEAPPGEPASRNRKLARWLLPLLVLIAVIAILLWQRSGPALAVTGAAVHPSSPSLTCGGTATLTATVHTNGASGTITYRWKRSDGTVSDNLQQQVGKGSTTVQVVLLWAFHGQGALSPTATFELLSPGAVTAAATFTYSCD